MKTVALQVLFLVLFLLFIGRVFSSELERAMNAKKTYAGKFTAKYIQISDDTTNRHKVIIEKGGEFPRVSNKHVRYGKNSILVEVTNLREGVKSSFYIKNRSEVHMEKLVPLQKDHWFQFSVYFPKNFSKPDNWFLFFQAWQKNAGNPILSMGIDQTERLYVAIRNDSYHIIPMVLYRSSNEVSKGVWQDFVIHLKGGLKQNGSLFVWQRLAEKQACFVPLIERRGLNVGKSVYRNKKLIKRSQLYISPRVGIYRGRSNLLHQLWFDGLRYGELASMRGFRICSE